MEQIIKYVVGEMRVIAEAPVTFGLALIALVAAIWWFMDWRYAGVIVNKDSDIASKVGELALARSQRDDYKDKLSGATPDQAKARIDSLEARLGAVEPRRLTSDQRAALIARLSPPGGATPTISIAAEASGDSSQLAADFSAAFRSAGGWNIAEPMVMGIGNRPPSGIGINLPDPAKPSPEVLVVIKALQAAKIPFDVRQAAIAPGAAVDMLICTKVAR